MVLVAKLPWQMCMRFLGRLLTVVSQMYASSGDCSLYVFYYMVRPLSCSWDQGMRFCHVLIPC